MAFNNDKAIYLQIADRLSDEILAGVYKAFDRIPSVRVCRHARHQRQHSG